MVWGCFLIFLLLTGEFCFAEHYSYYDTQDAYFMNETANDDLISEDKLQGTGVTDVIVDVESRRRDIWFQMPW
jgi:hypothetical protein